MPPRFDAGTRIHGSCVDVYKRQLIHSLRLSVERRLISHVSAGVEQHRQSGLGNLLIKRVNGSVIDMERLILGMELDPLQPQLNNLRHNGLIIGRKRINRTEAEQAVVFFLHLDVYKRQTSGTAITSSHKAESRLFR